MYRIVAFCESSGLRPIYKGEYVKKFIVPIIRNGNQWHGKGLLFFIIFLFLQE